MTARDAADGRLRKWAAQVGVVPGSVVLLGSGGLASTVLAYWAAHRRVDVLSLSVDLGDQSRGVGAAAATASRLGCTHRVLDVSAAIRVLRQLPAADSPGARARRSGSVSPMPLLVELGVAAATHRGAAAVLLGLHGDDTLVDAALVRTRGSVHVPLAELTVAEVVRLGVDLQVPLEQTWSCERVLPTHCGACSGCRRRRGAFAAATVPDRTPYRYTTTGGR